MAELTPAQRQELAAQKANLCSADQLNEPGQPITQKKLDDCEAAVDAQYRADLEPKGEPKADFGDAVCYVANEVLGTELGGLCPSNAGAPNAGNSIKR